MSERPKRGRYSKSYLKMRRDGAQYHRGVPMALQPVLGKVAWAKWLGNITRSDAIPLARALAFEHDKLITSLLALGDAERQQIIAAGGLDKWTAVNVGDRADLLVAEATALTLPDPDKSDTEQAADALTAFRARERAAKLRHKAKGARKIARTIVLGPDADAEKVLKLQAVYDSWVPGVRSTKEHGKMRNSIALFVDVNGDLAPRAVIRSHAIKFRNHVANLVDKDGGKLKTAPANHIARMTTLFSVAMREGLADSNPFYKVKLPKVATPPNLYDREDDGRPFSREQLKLILSRLGDLEANDAIVLRIMIFNGARSGEVCQLRACDILKADGVDAMRICAEAPRASLKNKYSRRTVPLHRAIKADVVKLAAHIAAAKGADAFLFDYPFWASMGNYAGKFQQRAGAWLRKIGITDEEITLHSARHTFRDACETAAIPEYIINQLEGRRRSKGSGGGYGKGVAVRDLAKWIARVDPLKVS